ncbi:isochorismate synthase [Fodinisporobacter ferrooxydans]|uniref:Isochorismate synthase MenF n=1 Tax=Fodinisporobacter ferrooxydans TaxID=2901836 RepID=A0ABY4CL97_9BACL|nr:isochorismate synthase [Alicyclobacillaceae bacterium MYW30-H2]
MVTIEMREELYQVFLQGKERAKQLSKPILVSKITKIEPIDPLAFFLFGKQYFKGTRTFWADPEQEMVLVGIGSAYTLKSYSNRRFQDAERKWNAVVANCIVTPDLPAPAVGPVLLGGFTFDPARKQSSLWKNYAHSYLVVPKFLVTLAKDGQAWLTTNAYVHASDDITEAVESIHQMQQQIVQLRAFETDVDAQFYHVQEADRESWMQAVEQLAAEIRAQQLEKVVLARELRVHAAQYISIENVLHRLQEEQPLSYRFAIESDQDCFLGATPERLIKKQGNVCLSACLAGSIARGKTLEEDRQLGEQLLSDPKNRHEHHLVVAMIRSALEDMCEDVKVPEHPMLYRVRDIQHLYTPVVGIVKPDSSILSIVERLHPTPALGGFPKESALAKIRELEPFERGFYGAPVGWLDSQGNGEFAVAIRSGLLQKDEASLFAGCGIVGESDPESEYKETELKFKPMISALGGSWNDWK